MESWDEWETEIQERLAELERRSEGAGIMAELVLAGRLDVESQSGKPTRGRGRIVLSESGVTWEVSKLLSWQIDHASWSEVHTFGRDGGSLHIAWEKRFEGPASKLPATSGTSPCTASC